MSLSCKKLGLSCKIYFRISSFAIGPFISFVLVMLALDMIFHFNNSVKDKIDDELNKAQQKIEALEDQIAEITTGINITHPFEQYCSDFL